MIQKSTSFNMNLPTRAIAAIALLGASGGVTGFGVHFPSSGLLHGSRVSSVGHFLVSHRPVRDESILRRWYYLLYVVHVVMMVVVWKRGRTF
jgi:hypothetical protein